MNVYVWAHVRAAIGSPPRRIAVNQRALRMAYRGDCIPAPKPPTIIEEAASFTKRQFNRLFKRGEKK